MRALLVDAGMRPIRLESTSTYQFPICICRTPIRKDSYISFYILSSKGVNATFGKTPKKNRFLFLTLLIKMINGAEQVLILLFTAIKLPADANIEEDDKCFPPPYLAKLKRRSNVQEVAVAPRGAPRRRRTNGLRRCGNCNQPGHTRSKCRFNSV